jgi:hypothetical protein
MFWSAARDRRFGIFAFEKRKYQWTRHPRSSNTRALSSSVALALTLGCATPLALRRVDAVVYLNGQP